MLPKLLVGMSILCFLRSTFDSYQFESREATKPPSNISHFICLTIDLFTKLIFIQIFVPTGSPSSKNDIPSADTRLRRYIGDRLDRQEAKLLREIKGMFENMTKAFMDMKNVGLLFINFMYIMVKITHGILVSTMYLCERFEPWSHFKSRLCLIIWVNLVLNRTVVVDSD